MRLLSLDLAWFGPFADRTIDLSAGERGLHLLYGPNEAGKTTTRRALHALFYGVPHQSKDGWRDEKIKPRVGARLRSDDGAELEVYRIKSTKDTLRDASGAVLPDEALRPFLCGVSDEEYSKTFSIGHDELTRGGEELLAGGGDLGAALFGAALGGGTLRSFMKQLDDNRRALFKPTGSAPAINQNLRQHKELSQAVRQATLSGSKWTEKRHELRRAEESVTELAATRDEALRAVHRLERLQRVAGPVDRWRAATDDRAALGEVPRLDRAAREHRLEAEQAIEALTEELRLHGAALERSQAERANLDIAGDLLDAAEAIERLHRALGGQDERERDLPRKRHDILKADTRNREALRQLQPTLSLDALAEHGVPRAAASRLRKLVQQLEGLQSALRQSTRHHAEASAALAALPDAPPPPEGLHRLRVAVQDAVNAGLSDRQLDQQRRELDAQREAFRRSLNRLPGLPEPHDQLDLLPLPSVETVTHWQQRHDHLLRRQAEHQLAADHAQRELDLVQRELDKITAAGAVLTDELLHAARLTRDQRLDAVVEQWTAGLTPSDPPARAELSALRHDTHHADQLADQRQADAARVSRYQEHLGAARVLEQRLDRTQATLAAIDAEAEALQAEWTAHWSPSGVQPGPATEMAGWLGRCAQAITQLHAARAAERELDRLTTEHRAHAAAVDEAVRALGGEPQGLVRARELLDALEQAAVQHQHAAKARDELTARLHRHALEHDDHTRALADWQAAWTEAVQLAGLAEGLRPDEADEVLTGLQQLVAALETQANDRRRVEAMERDQQAFLDSVHSVIASCAPDLHDAPPREAVETMLARLRRARSAADRAAALDAQITQTQARLQADTLKLQARRARLARLCEQAGVTTADELPAQERLSERAATLDAEITALREELRRHAEGADFHVLLTELDHTDRDELPVQLHHARNRAEQSEAALREANQRVGQARAELHQMDGSDEAARQAEQLALVEADLEQQAHEYLQLQLAHALLAAELERHRKEQQGPTLSRASQIFRQLTLGQFDGLESDYVDDKPTLLALRSDRRPLGVAQLSDGTRDQLYFALRLASLHQRAHEHEPMPLVVDDVLIRFDQDRARAALLALADLSARCQVLFFTHSEALREIAAGLASSAPVFVHRLG
jgi:uncharacterized protein YhaN